MHIYFCGIGGAGLGPLALVADDCDIKVSGSDTNRGFFTEKFNNRENINLYIGEQTGDFLIKCHQDNPIDWFIYTSALKQDHAELVKAKELGIKCSKRDEFLNYFISENNLKLAAVSGTHGKTTTTAMLVWLFKQARIPVSYQIGTNISFGESAKFDQKSEFFVYEADEYDRNMLNFHPFLSILPSVDWDHPDIYPTANDYRQAFQDFINQSKKTLTWDHIAKEHSFDGAETYHENNDKINSIKLAGIHNRKNAFLACEAFCNLVENYDIDQAIQLMSDFPGTERRFEKLAENIYTDYAHHPSEIRATIQMANEINPNVIVVYQPHQDKRQREIIDQYFDTFKLAKKIYWLETYEPAGRENNVKIPAQEFIKKLDNSQIAEVADMNDQLTETIKQYAAQGDLVLCCSAGSLDAWLRSRL